MSFPKTGNFLHRGDEAPFVVMVSSVLRGAMGSRPASIKQVARWTGASERTVKNWFAGTCAPRGHHFLGIVRHCPEMLETFLVCAGRGDRLASAHVDEARNQLRLALSVLDALAHGGVSDDRPSR